MLLQKKETTIPHLLQMGKQMICLLYPIHLKFSPRCRRLLFSLRRSRPEEHLWADHFLLIEAVPQCLFRQYCLVEYFLSLSDLDTGFQSSLCNLGVEGCLFIINGDAALLNETS